MDLVVVCWVVTCLLCLLDSPDLSVLYCCGFGLIVLVSSLGFVFVSIWRWIDGLFIVEMLWVLVWVLLR